MKRAEKRIFNFFSEVKSTVKRHDFLQFWTRNNNACSKMSLSRVWKIARKKFICQFRHCCCPTDNKIRKRFHLDPIHPKPERLNWSAEGVLSTTGEQEKDTNGYELSKLDYIELFRENPQKDVRAFFRSGIDVVLSLSVSSDMELGGSTEKPNVGWSGQHGELSFENALDRKFNWTS